MVHEVVTVAITRWIEFREGATVHCGIGVDASGHLTIVGAAGTTLATSTYAMTASIWSSLEAKAVIHDTTGSLEVKVDGTVIVSATGIDTRNGGTGVVNTIAVRKTNNAGSTTTSSLDCFYIGDNTGAAPLNGYVGDIAIRLQLPNGNGDSSDWVGSDGNSTDNYLLVDEATANATDYVGTAATAKTDLYALTDIPTTDLPLATQAVIYAAKSDAGTPPVLKMVTKGDGGTVVEESAVTLSTTYQMFAGAIRLTDPDGDTLTATNVNGMQGGVRTA
jgi:hypothetical protein